MVEAGQTPIGHVISVAGSEVWGLIETRAAPDAAIGRVVRIDAKAGRTFGVITSLKRDGRRRAQDDRRFLEIRMVGEILEDGVFQRGVSSHPALDGPIYPASVEELSTMYARPDAATVRLGRLNQAPDIDAFALTDNLLGKHFAVLGTTGAGKSCSVTLILQAILDAHPYGHIVMIDPHNEYGRAFAGRAELLNPANLKLPYWLLTFEEMAQVLVSRDSPERAYAETAILRRAITQVRQQAAGGGEAADHVTVDTPIPYRMSELGRIMREEMGAFNRADAAAPYQHLLTRIEALTNDRRFAFMFSSFLVQDNMRQVLSQLLRIPVAGKPLTIIDISGVPSEIVDVVVSVLFRLVFEFALWSEREQAPPILLVCEEAHRYVPLDASAGFAPTRQSIARIAKEGRKYGLGLCLVTQRPSELALNSLSQCNTIFALRLGNERDLEFVRGAVPDGSRWLVDALPALNTREAIVVGDGVSVPMHIRFDELPPERRPASTTPQFSSRWREGEPAPDLIEQTIVRWRQQIRPGEVRPQPEDLTATATPPPRAPAEVPQAAATVVPEAPQPAPAAGFGIRRQPAAGERTAVHSSDNGHVDHHPPGAGAGAAPDHHNHNGFGISIRKPVDAASPPPSPAPDVAAAPSATDPPRPPGGSSFRRRFAARFG